MVKRSSRHKKRPRPTGRGLPLIALKVSLNFEGLCVHILDEVACQTEVEFYITLKAESLSCSLVVVVHHVHDKVVIGEFVSYALGCEVLFNLFVGPVLACRAHSLNTVLSFRQSNLVRNLLHFVCNGLLSISNEVCDS